MCNQIGNQARVEEGEDEVDEEVTATNAAIIGKIGTCTTLEYYGEKGVFDRIGKMRVCDDVVEKIEDELERRVA